MIRKITPEEVEAAREQLRILAKVYSQRELAVLLRSYQPNVAGWLNGRPISRRVCEDIAVLFEQERARHNLGSMAMPPPLDEADAAQDDGATERPS